MSNLDVPFQEFVDWIFEQPDLKYTDFNSFNKNDFCGCPMVQFGNEKGIDFFRCSSTGWVSDHRIIRFKELPQGIKSHIDLMPRGVGYASVTRFLFKDIKEHLLKKGITPTVPQVRPPEFIDLGACWAAPQTTIKEDLDRLCSNLRKELGLTPAKAPSKPEVLMQDLHYTDCWKLECNAFTIYANNITQAVQCWNKLKTQVNSYEDVVITEITHIGDYFQHLASDIPGRKESE
jgi:hypothetical protein